MVKPKISHLTWQRSRVLARTSAQIAAIDIGLPLIEPELSNNIVTTVSLKSVSFSTLNDNGVVGFDIIRANRPASNNPSSISKDQDLFC